MNVDFSIDRINKILEKQNSDFKVVDDTKKSVCSLVIEDIKNKKIDKMNRTFFKELKESL